MQVGNMLLLLSIVLVLMVTAAIALILLARSSSEPKKKVRESEKESRFQRDSFEADSIPDDPDEAVAWLEQKANEE
jgi:hypothetical protein